MESKVSKLEKEKDNLKRLSDKLSEDKVSLREQMHALTIEKIEREDEIILEYGHQLGEQNTIHTNEKLEMYSQKFKLELELESMKRKLFYKEETLEEKEIEIAKCREKMNEISNSRDYYKSLWKKIFYVNQKYIRQVEELLKEKRESSKRAKAQEELIKNLRNPN